MSKERNFSSLKTTEGLSEPMETGECIKNPETGKLKIVPHTEEVAPLWEWHQEVAGLPIQERTVQAREILRKTERPYVETFLVKPEEKELQDSRLFEDSLHLGEIVFGIETKDWSIKEAIQTQPQEKGVKPADGQKEIGNQKKLLEAFIDVFIKDFLLREDGSEGFMMAAANILEQEGLNIRQADIEALLDRARNRIIDLDSREPEVIDFMNYKDESNNLINGEQAAILQQLIEASVSDKYSKSPFGQSLQPVAEAMLKFYWNNRKKLYGKKEETPLVAFLHDYFFAAALIQDREFFCRVSEWIKPLLLKRKTEFDKEIRICDAHLTEEEEKTSRQLFVDSGRIKGDSFWRWMATISKEYIEQWSPIDRGCFIGTHYDRAVGLDSVFSLLEWPQLTEIWNTVLEEQRNARPRKGKKGITEYKFQKGAYEIALSWRFKLTGGFGKSANLLDTLASVMHLKGDYLRNKAELTGENLFDLGRKKYYQKLIGLLAQTEIPQDFKKKLITYDWIFAAFIEEAPLNIDELREAEARNDHLFELINNQNVWFVALHGDQFQRDENPELNKYGIESITFYPNREMPRAYMIKIVSDLQVEDDRSLVIDLILDGNGKLYYSDGTSLILPTWLTSSFETLVFERLNFITGGALKEPIRVKVISSEGEEEDKEERTLLYRRPHYRALMNDPGEEPIYNLQSASAQMHAQNIFKDYGINIYEENARRKAEGAIPKPVAEENQRRAEMKKPPIEDWWLTYVREHIDEEIDWSQQRPNQLKYQPELL